MSVALALPPPGTVGIGACLHWLGIRPGKLAADLDVAPRTVQRWAAGTPRPNGVVLGRVEDWFAVRGVPPELVWAAPLEAPVSIHDLDAERRTRGLLGTSTPPHDQEDRPVEFQSREYLEPEELEHFGLSADPFDEPEDPEELWMPDHLRRIERALLDAIRRRQIVVLVGPPGSGKSSLLRRMYGRVSNEKKVRMLAPASLDRRRITHAALATAILRDLIGRETSSMSQEARSELLRTTLEEQDRAGQFPCLLIDEGHHLANSALLAIKHLWDSHTLFRQLAVIVVGQLPLEGRLRADPEIRELTGRARILRLPGVGEQTGEYLRWRFSRIGGNADQVFTPDAAAALGARGECPLWINNLAVLAMRHAYTIGDEQVTAVHVGRS